MYSSLKLAPSTVDRDDLDRRLFPFNIVIILYNIGMKIIIHLFVSALAIVIATFLVPGASVTLLSAIVLAVVLGIINIFIKPVVKFITFPITLLTLGLFSLVINALFILLAAKIVPGFSVAGFWPAFWFSIVLSLINAFFGMFENDEDK